MNNPDLTTRCASTGTDGRFLTVGKDVDASILHFIGTYEKAKKLV